jgi:hypothetical protein
MRIVVTPSLLGKLVRLQQRADRLAGPQRHRFGVNDPLVRTTSVNTPWSVMTGSASSLFHANLSAPPTRASHSQTVMVHPGGAASNGAS